MITELEKQKTLEPISFDVKEEVISKMEAEYLPLKLNGVEDKDGYNKIVEYRKNVKGLRVSVEKRRKQLKALALDYGRDVDSQAKEIFKRLEPIESHLQEQEDIIKKEKERIEAEKERIKQENHDNQIKKIISTGAVFDGSKYVYGEKSITDTEIWLISDSDFDLLIREISIWKKEDDNRRAEEEKARKAEEERQAEIAAENARRQAELDRREREQAEAQAKIKAEQDRLERERQERENERRIAKAKEEAAEKARLEAIEAEKRHQEELKQAKIEAEQKAKAEAEERERQRIEAEKAAKEEAERLARLKPDKEKLEVFANSLLEIKAPELNEVESVNIADKAMLDLSNIAKSILKAIK